MKMRTIDHAIARSIRILITISLLLMIIAAAAQAGVNLVPAGRDGWYAPVVPRVNDDATPTSCPLFNYRIGRPYFYWNAHGENTGPDPTPGGFDVSVYLDGAYRGIAYAGATSGEFAVVNQGPISADICGLHTLSCYVDALHSVTETEENDNVWGGQYIWDFIDLWVDGSSVNHVAPPDPTGGWEHIVDGSTPRENCDGYSFKSDKKEWQAVTVTALDSADNYDARLYEFDHLDNIGGFHTLRAISDRGAGQLDVLFLNCYYDAFQNYYNVSVVNANDGEGDYRITRWEGYDLPFETETAFTLEADENLDIWGFSLDAAQQGPVMAVLEAPADSGLKLLRFDARDAGDWYWAGNLSDAAASRAVDARGMAVLDFTVSNDREQALVVYREPGTGNGVVSGTVRLVAPTADLEFQEAAWWSPLVPSDQIMTDNPVFLPDSLPGNLVGTYHNYLIRNAGTAGTGTFSNRLMIDGILAHDVLYLAGIPAETTLPYWQQYAEEIRGGRHTVSLLLDINGQVAELDEDNNIYAEQYCWTPLNLTYGVPVVRPAPPPDFGGEEHLPEGEVFYRNCDGVRMPYQNVTFLKNGWWRGVAVMPGAASELQLFLHPAGTGAKDGFADYLHYSLEWGDGVLNYVAVNFRNSPHADYDVGIRQVDPSAENVTTEAVTSAWLGVPSGKIYGPFDLPSQHIMDLYELRLEPDVYALRLDNLSGTGRLGMALHEASSEYVALLDGVVPNGQGHASGPGDPVTFTLDVPNTGNYCLAVYKLKANDLPEDISYRLWVLPGVTGVEDMPEVKTTGLGPARPNPFNPRTELVYEVRQGQHVMIGIYDMKGCLVRTLFDAHRDPGRYEVVWDGADNHGRYQSSGVYLARMWSAEGTSTRRLTLVR